MPSKLASDLLNYTEAAGKYGTPNDVLDSLNTITTNGCCVHVLGAALLPLVYGSRKGMELGKTVFLHSSVPKEWWEERNALAAGTPPPFDVLARLSMAPYTRTEMMKALEPLGVDRWTVELGQKYGMRDFLGCPVGGRWIFVYWSRKVINLAPDQRALLFMAASFAASRLQALAPSSTERLIRGTGLTARELSVLRLMSLGQRVAEVARHLGLGEETVRSHVKKAQAKLGVTNTMHAVTRAMRLRSIP